MSRTRYAGSSSLHYRCTDFYENAQSGHSIISSAGAIGKQFNPDGNIGQIGEKVGGPFSKEGVIGSQFDASKGGVAGTVEKMVGGPSQKPSS
jgi:hypothetical protein